MSKYEERVYRTTNKKPNIAELKNQLMRLRHDLAQFTARKPDGAVVAPLQARIHELEAEIAEAQEAKRREEQASSGDADDMAGRFRSGQGSMRATSSRFPPRGRPGR